MAKKIDKNSRNDVVNNRSQVYNNDRAYKLHQRARRQPVPG